MDGEDKGRALSRCGDSSVTAIARAIRMGDCYLPPWEGFLTTYFNTQQEKEVSEKQMQRQ